MPRRRRPAAAARSCQRARPRPREAPLQRGLLRLEVGGKLPRRRVVEDQRARQRRRALAERLLQLVAQLHRAQRVEPRLHQRRVRMDCAARRARRQRQHRLDRYRRDSTGPRSSSGCRSLHPHGCPPPVPMRRQQRRHHASAACTEQPGPVDRRHGR
eukprot:scaffold3774_cov53-Phaeocystis_antarctica.AAC.2